MSPAVGGKTVTGWLLGSSLVFAMAFCCLDNGLNYIRNFRDYDDQSCQTCQMHWFLLKMNLKFAPIASVLLVFYWANATFYECGDQFDYYTLAYFSGKLDIFVAIAWFFLGHGRLAILARVWDDNWDVDVGPWEKGIRSQTSRVLEAEDVSCGLSCGFASWAFYQCHQWHMPWWLGGFYHDLCLLLRKRVFFFSNFICN